MPKIYNGTVTCNRWCNQCAYDMYAIELANQGYLSVESGGAFNSVFNACNTPTRFKSNCLFNTIHWTVNYFNLTQMKTW